MKQGRDLRNKAILHQGVVYCIGGNNYTSEKFNILKQEWRNVNTYKHFIVNNLDSWCCALSNEPNIIDNIEKFK